MSNTHNSSGWAEAIIYTVIVLFLILGVIFIATKIQSWEQRLSDLEDAVQQK